ncbi:MAG: acetolactate synthase [Clostridiales bacterium]|nr:acetolactate synthase [Clostridiales bacterium]
MTVKQISVFLENKPGRLSELTEVLSENGIDMLALSLAEASDFGIVRVIVDDVYKASTVLKDADYIISITKVLAVEIADEPGALAKVIGVLGESEINVEYMYAFTARKKDCACMIIRVEDNGKAVEALRANGMRPICLDELLAM